MKNKTVIIAVILDDEKPNGPRYYSISNHNCSMMVIPRSDLDVTKERDELKKSAFYILLGEGDQKPKAYIGETENFANRVKDHDSKKDFWNMALVFFKSNGNLTTTDVKYLEYKGISLAKKLNNYKLDENKQIPNKPSIPEFQQIPMDDFFGDCCYLTSFIGLKIFEKLNPKKDNLFYLTREGGTECTGTFVGEKFVVLKGSSICNKVAKSLKERHKKLRDAVIKNFAQVKKGVITLTSDVSFDSPSTASCVCLGYSSNGWISWKDKDGKKLNEVLDKKMK